jgi:predicted TIM-barrel fold metal-dependent hydrolase
MNEQGLAAVWMFPTLGVLYEQALKADPEAVAITFQSFNRWLDEDWGLHYQDRIFAAPYITLADLDAALRELEWAIDRGARVVCMRPAAPTTAGGPRSPGDEMFDPFWARVNESGLTVAVHGADSGYGLNGYGDDGSQGALLYSPLRALMSSERAIKDFFSAVLCDQLFTRFPNIRMASIENGAGYLRDFLNKLRKVGKQYKGYFREDPVEVFRDHVWVNPFWEDDVNEVVDLMTASHVLFGSDWPHAEGLPDPLDYLSDVKHLALSAQGKIMRSNVQELTELRPAH